MEIVVENSKRIPDPPLAKESACADWLVSGELPRPSSRHFVASVSQQSQPERRQRFGTELLCCCVLFGALAGCSSPAARKLSDAERQQTISALTTDLLALGSSAGSREARTFAETAVDEANVLGIQYRAIRPPWFHNVLVNAKLKQRGLCYQWANDLWRKLTDLPNESFELHFAVARLGTPREHNAIVVTLRGQPFAEGLVLDAWRHSGVLVWSPVATDRYPWQPMQ